MLLNNIYAIAVAPDKTLPMFSSEAWSYAGQTALLGMGMIFAVLGLLWGLLSVFKLVFTEKTPKAPKPVKVKAADDKPAEKVENKVAPAPVAAAATQDDGALIAVLTAAIAAYMAESGEEYTGGFRVVSFTRVKGGKPWNSK